MNTGARFLTLLTIIVVVIFWSCQQTTNVSEDQEPPEITYGPVVDSVLDSSAVIYWETNEPANAKVIYWVNTPGQYEKKDEEFRMYHTIQLTGLTPYENYVFYVESEDFFGNGPTRSGEFTFRTTQNEVSYARIGWGFFESGEYDSSLYYFELSTQYNSEYGAGYSGLGWSYLRLEEFFESVAAFTSAIERDTLALDALTGRAAGYRVLNDYDLVVQDAEEVLDKEPQYVFVHDTSVNYLDLHLLAAEAYYYLADYEQAQSHVDAVAPDNGLNSADSLSWVVDNTQYDTYIEALLALIQSLVQKIL